MKLPRTDEGIPMGVYVELSRTLTSLMCNVACLTSTNDRAAHRKVRRMNRACGEAEKLVRGNRPDHSPITVGDVRLCVAANLRILLAELEES